MQPSPASHIEEDWINQTHTEIPETNELKPQASHDRKAQKQNIHHNERLRQSRAEDKNENLENISPPLAYNLVYCVQHQIWGLYNIKKNYSKYYFLLFCSTVRAKLL